MMTEECAVCGGWDKRSLGTVCETCWNAPPSRPDPRDEVIAELVALVADALEIIDDQMPGEFPAFATDARAALTKHKGTNP